MFSITIVFLLGITSVMSKDLYSFKVKDWQGNDISLEQYRGKVNIEE